MKDDKALFLNRVVQSFTRVEQHRNFAARMLEAARKQAACYVGVTLTDAGLEAAGYLCTGNSYNIEFCESRPTAADLRALTSRIPNTKRPALTAAAKLARYCLMARWTKTLDKTARMSTAILIAYQEAVMAENNRAWQTGAKVREPFADANESRADRAKNQRAV